MIKGWNYLTIIYGVLSALFISILLFGETNMFTIPIALVFVIGTIYCVMQWYLMNLFKKIEATHPDWK